MALSLKSSVHSQPSSETRARVDTRDVQKLFASTEEPSNLRQCVFKDFKSHEAITRLFNQSWYDFEKCT